jgi:Mu-like prophage I protein
MTPKKIKLRRAPEPQTRFERVVLDLGAAAADLPVDDLPKWVQVANAGDYRGYSGGRFVFDDGVFDQIIANIHAHPSFVAGADGVGSTDVIPWDFNHASEAFAGDVAVEGTPAQAWVQDLQKRQGPEGPQLWALTRWLEPAKSYVRDGKYKWASVVVGFDCRDPKTNANVGAVLASVALTNQPFIEGMLPLVASKQGAAMSGKQQQGQRVAAQYWYGDKASSAEDALRLIRNMLELPQTADLGVIMGQLANLQAWSLGTSAAPLGVDLDQLVANLRCILNLPALSDTATVFAECQKLLSSMLDQQTVEDNETTLAAPAAPPANDVPPPSAAQAERTHMSLKIVASKLQVVETESAVVERVEGLLALRATLAKHVGVPANSNDAVILEAAAGSTDVRGKLGAILKALGVEDSDGAVDKVAGLMKQAKDLEAAMPELSELREAAAKTEEKAADADVEKVMNSKGIDDAGVREALTLSRKTNKKAFCERYAEVLAKPAEPAAAAPSAHTAHLTSNLSGIGGAERKVTNNADGSVSLSAPVAGKAGQNPGGKVRVDLSKTPGANRTAKAVNYVADQPGGKDMTYDQKFEAARKLLKECDVVDSGSAA